jgi:uncharacterized protein (TIGR03437 family)
MGQTGSVELAVHTDSAQLLLPAVVSPRGNQRSLEFQGSVQHGARQESAAVSIELDGAFAEEGISILPDSAPVITLPDSQAVISGELVAFAVTANDPGGSPVRLSASPLPPGAVFDAGSGYFEWTPTAAQRGDHVVTFTAANQANVSVEKQLRIRVGAGSPSIARATMPVSGSIVRLNGEWLGPIDEASDAGGRALELGGTRVKVNGAYVPVLYAGLTQVSFLCPNGAAGERLEILVETPAGSSEAFRAQKGEANPEVLVSPTGRPMVLLAGSTQLATVRDVTAAGYPAQPGDLLTIQAAGLPKALPIAVLIGGVYAEVRSITPASAGTWEIQVALPQAVPAGTAIPLELQVTLEGGQLVQSKPVEIAIERAR